MWARVVEIMLGCWLAVSPFVFRHGGEETVLWVVDWSAAVAIVVIGLVSYWPPARHVHLLVCLVGICLCAFAYLWEPYPTQPALQNHFVIGLLLLMFGILPNWASEAPVAWEKFEQERIA